MDTSEKASCYDMPTNQICPLFHHKGVGPDRDPYTLMKLSLANVEVQLGSIPVTGETPACRKYLREYTCSNTLMQCTPSSATIYGFILRYDVARTREACANVTKSCSLRVQAAINNCNLIQTDPFDYAICNRHTPVPGDVCPATAYTVRYAQ